MLWDGPKASMHKLDVTSCAPRRRSLPVDSKLCSWAASLGRTLLGEPRATCWLMWALWMGKSKHCSGMHNKDCELVYHEEVPDVWSGWLLERMAACLLASKLCSWAASQGRPLLSAPRATCWLMWALWMGQVSCTFSSCMPRYSDRSWLGYCTAAHMSAQCFRLPSRICTNNRCC